MFLSTPVQPQLGAACDGGSGLEDAAATAVAKAATVAAVADECAKGRLLPKQKMVEDELAEYEEGLQKVRVDYYYSPSVISVISVAVCMICTSGIPGTAAVQQ